MKKLLLILPLLLLTGCEISTATTYNASAVDDIWKDVVVHEDSQHDVICWIYHGYNGRGGISCLPKDQLITK